MIKYINANFFKSIKGKFLNIIKNKKVLFVTLASVITLTGCSNQIVVEEPKIEVDKRPVIEQSNTIEIPSIQESTVETNKPAPIIKTKLDEEMLNIIRTEVSLNDSALTKFKNKVGNIDVKYQHSELFGTELALERYNSIKEYESNASVYIINGKIDKSKLKTTILENNKEYLSSYSGSRYSEFSSSDFNKVFNVFLESLEFIINNGTDLGQLDEKLGDLKILKMTSNGNGVMTDENTILALNLDVIATNQVKNPNIDYLRTVVLHETNHFGQINSENEKEKEGYDRNMGISYRWDDLKINPLNYSWYNEGAAEKLMTAQYGKPIEPTVYPNNIKSMDSITLSALLRNDVDELTLAKLSLQTDLNELFKIFNCADEQDKIEVINMMYAFDITINQNAEFFTAYKDKYGKQIDNRYDYFNSLNSSIAQTLTKNFYINLSNYLISNDATLEDIFSNISIFETEMSRLTKYGSQSNLEENEAFISMYRGIQNEFFGIVAQYLGLDVEDITMFYNAYYGDALSDVSTTSTLDEYELDYVNRILDSRSMNKKNTINEVGESFKIK